MRRKKHPLEKTLRERGVTQGALAKELGISGAMLSRIIHGKRRPGIDNALRISKLLGVPMETFFQ